MREKPSGSDDEGGYGDASNALAIKSDEIKLLVKVDKIGDSTPIQDFEAMMSRRDSPDWVAKAIKDMENKICNIVENCRGGDNFHKALECLVALRKGCILEQVILFFWAWFTNLGNLAFFFFNVFLVFYYNFIYTRGNYSICNIWSLTSTVVGVMTDDINMDKDRSKNSC